MVALYSQSEIVDLLLLFRIKQKMPDNLSFALKRRYLNAYERLHHFGLDPDSHEDGADLDDLPSSRRKTACPVGGVAVTYNYQQHNLLG